MPVPSILTEWDSRSIVDSVKSDGIVVLDRFFGGEKLKALNAEFSLLFDAQGEKVQTHHKTEYIDAKHIDPRKLDRKKFPALSSLADDPVLRQSAEDYFQKPIIYPHKIFATWSKGTEQALKKLPFVAHTDRFQMFKYMIYLHDVTATTGAMAAAPGRHKELAARRLEWIRSGKPYEQRPNVLHEFDAELTPVEAKAGSILVFDTDVPHKAGHVQPGFERHSLRIDIVCPSYAGTNGKRKLMDRLFRRKVVTD